MLELRRTTPRRARDDQRWFAQHAEPTLLRFLRELHRQGLARVPRFTKNVARRQTPLGPWVFALSHLVLDLDGHSPIAVTGEGQDPKRATASVISNAELIERLSFLLHVRSSRLLGTVPRPPSTNGACLHTSPEDTIRGAVCELLERDAFLSNWYSAHSLPETRLEAGSVLATASRALAKAGWRLRQHLWRHDLAPAYCAMVTLTREPVVAGQWSFFIGGGASYDRDAALRRALREAIFLSTHHQQTAERVDVTEPVSPRLLSEPQSRTLYFQRPEAISTFLGRLRPTAMPTRRLLAPTARAFIDRAFERITDLRLEALPLPAPLADRTFSVQAVSGQLQGLDWRVPAGIHEERVRALYGTRRPALTQYPHPVG